ncbi:hypothetical protein [Actinomycetospora sp. TBRC 11914]|uniref:hypothetical protein n=1 Tax=Actinomycetospora sp. TBRC 11914 TaxID=2729387 RepID=UPI00145EFF57|nr:hypothetical protein [Actinomycetospora sp. TBRC 11914]NMO91703.1 DUF4175 domain-containing protein [Actinomycetospora sp. TBRC 11914]
MLAFLLIVAGAVVAAAAARGIVLTARLVIASDPDGAPEEPSAARLAATGVVLLVAGVTLVLAALGLLTVIDLVCRIGVVALVGGASFGGASAWACRHGRCFEPPAQDEIGRELGSESRVGH